MGHMSHITSASAPITDYSFRAILKELVICTSGNCRAPKAKPKLPRSTAPTALSSTLQTFIPAVPAVTSTATTEIGTRVASNMTSFSPRNSQPSISTPTRVRNRCLILGPPGAKLQGNHPATIQAIIQ